MFIATAANLTKALSLALASAEVKGTMPILAYVLFEGKDGVLRLTATDVDSTIETQVETVECEDFAWCVHGDLLSRLVRLLSGDVMLVESKGRIAVKADGIEHLLPMQPAVDFPPIQAASESVGSISGTLLAQMLTLALLGAETNPNGVDWQKNLEVISKGGQLTITGCSNARISSVSARFGGEVEAVIPVKAAATLAAFAETSESVSIACSDNLFSLWSSVGAAHSRLSALRMADWRQMLKTDYAHQVELASEAVLLPLRRAIFASNTDAINIGLNASQMTLSGQNVDTGQRGQETLPIQCPTLNGSTHALRILGNQLIDFFRSCDSAVFEIHPRDDGHSDLRLRLSKTEDYEWLYIPTTLRLV